MVPEIAVQALQHAERRNGHTDRDDQVRVHYVDFKGSGNLLKTGHVLEHIDAVIKQAHKTPRTRARKPRSRLSPDAGNAFPAYP